MWSRTNQEISAKFRKLYEPTFGLFSLVVDYEIYMIDYNFLYLYLHILHL